MATNQQVVVGTATPGQAGGFAATTQGLQSFGGNAYPDPLTPLRGGNSSGMANINNIQQQQPSYTTTTTTPAAAGNAGMPLSLSNAFADMGPSADAPLPALGSSANTSTEQQQPNTNAYTPAKTYTPATPVGQSGSGGGGFGFYSLGSPSVMDIASRIHKGDSVTATTAVAVADSSTTAVRSISNAVGVSEGDDDDDDFGDFGSAPSQPPIPPTYNNTNSNIDNNGTSGPLSMGSPQRNELGSGQGALLFTPQSPPPQQQQQPFVTTEFGRDLSQPSNGSSTALPSVTNVVAPTPSMLVSDPFGDMVPIQDAPLPSLDAFGSNIVGGGMDIGAEHQTTATTTTTTTTQEETTPAVVATDEGDNSDSDEDDGFGNFETAASIPAATDDSPNESGDFIGFDQEEPTLPSVSIDTSVGNCTNQIQQQQQQSFGIPMNAARTGFDTMAAPTPQMMSVTENGHSLSITDAFGDMPIQHEAPLPSLGDIMAMSTDVTDVTTAAGTMSTITQGQNNIETFGNEDDDDDGFGAFEAAAAATATATTTTLPESDLLQNDEYNKQSDDINNMEDKIDNDNDDVDFGDFDGAAAAGPTPRLPPSSPGSDFLGFGAGAEPANDNGDASTCAPQVALVSESLSTNAGLEGHVRSVYIDDAFGDLSATENAPLPSLEMIGASSNPSSPVRHTQGGNESHNEFEDDDDDFGGFSEAIPTSSTQGDGFPSVEDDDDDDEFGDFDTAPSEKGVGPSQQKDNAGGLKFIADATSIPDADRRLSTSDVFGNMPITNDVPLPSLDILSMPPNKVVESNALNTTDGENDEEFGRFETPATVPSVETEPTSGPDLAASGVSESLFPDTENTTTSDGNILDFDGVTPSIPNSVALSLPVTANPLSISDAFGNFEVADAPIPSLNPVESSQRELTASITQDNIMFGAFASHDESLISLNESAPAKGHVKGDGDDLFDMFGTEPQVPTDHGISHNEKNEFGDFGSAEVKADQVQNASDWKVKEEDDFDGFGSAEIAAPIDGHALDIQHLEEDDFGDFGSAEHAAPVTDFAHATQPQEEDGFGDFGSAEHTAPVADFAHATQPQEEDGFGDFGSAEHTAPVADFAHAAQPQEGDDFGDFGSAKHTAPVEVTDHAAQSAEGDYFGDFGTTELSTSVEQNVDDLGEFKSEISSPVDGNYDNTRSGEEDLFGAFGNAEPNPPIEQTAERSQPGGVEEFGDFGSAGFIAPVEQKANDVPPEEEDDFGDFGSAKFSPPLEQQTDIVQTESDDDFGDFTVVETSQTNGPGSDENLSDFASFEDSSPPFDHLQQASQPTAMNKDGEWGDFENISAPSTKNEFTEEARTRDRVRSLALQLPDCVLRKAGVSGDHVDLGESYENNVGIKSSMTEASRRRTQRCIQVLGSMTSTDNSKLASTFWAQVFDVVNEELEQAKRLLIETVSFSSEGWSEIRAPLSVMVRGLAEYMRVTRSIVASIGDVLLLDESAMLTVDTWTSTWCSLSVLEKALDCEKKWKEIQNQLIRTPLGAVDTVSVEKIRSEANSPHAGTRDNANAFCHLTLQPLREKNKDTTTDQVSFQGNSFMACSANFLANRCPFFLVGEDV